MKTDLTGSFVIAREQMRHLWNTVVAARSSSAEGTFDDVEEFERLCPEILGFVLQVRENLHILNPTEPLLGRWVFELVPRPTVRELSVLVRRLTSSPGIYWDRYNYKDCREAGLRLSLQFKAFYDWAVQGPRELRYCLGEIKQFPGHEELLGREAIVEFADVNVLLTAH